MSIITPTPNPLPAPPHPIKHPMAPTPDGVHERRVGSLTACEVLLKSKKCLSIGYLKIHTQHSGGGGQANRVKRQ